MRALLVSLFLTCVGLPASAFQASNGLVVETLGRQDFKIPYRGLSGDSDFWCAAGEYVIRDRGLSPSTRIFRLSAPPRRAGQGITFSLSSEGAKDPGIFVLSREKSLSASFARSLCNLPTTVER